MENGDARSTPAVGAHTFDAAPPVRRMLTAVPASPSLTDGRVGRDGDGRAVDRTFNADDAPCTRRRGREPLRRRSSVAPDTVDHAVAFDASL